ncbi:disease resistance protein RPP2A-like [Eucalyptus grandis]|uniref:disease resistance protein RPP2A-like n=1 Tax=Eucalyptus grandis TaxID=71139 RepID=UPI00192E9898|nr:disease resistance protein RPP2A-like [Eucalyptus grandis]
MLESKYGYEVKELNREDSLLLFSRHAFGGKPPPEDLATLSHEIVAATGGLPLVLMVMGSLLKGKEDQRVWKQMLEKLRNAPNTTVQQKLRMSYDALEHEEQQMFLDIACFFIGTDKRIASYLWDDLKFFPISGLAKMFVRSLIKYNDNNELIMHDQLRDLGRSIACPADKKPCNCSRLWDKEAMAVLGSKGNEYIEALRLDKDGSSKFMEQESFKRLPKLTLVNMNPLDFAGHPEELLCELRWLKWESCPYSFKATSVHLENLLVFDLSGGNIHENWEGLGSIKMERLKVLNLSSCSNLKTTPKLSAFKSLEMLILEYCRNLKQIDPSIGDVKNLVSLNLRYCVSLTKLPAELGQLKELEELLIDETDIKKSLHG